MGIFESIMFMAICSVGIPVLLVPFLNWIYDRTEERKRREI